MQLQMIVHSCFIHKQLHEWSNCRLLIVELLRRILLPCSLERISYVSLLWGTHHHVGVERSMAPWELRILHANALILHRHHLWLKILPPCHCWVRKNHARPLWKIRWHVRPVWVVIPHVGALWRWSRVQNDIFVLGLRAAASVASLARLPPLSTLKKQTKQKYLLWLFFSSVAMRRWHSVGLHSLSGWSRSGCSVYEAASLHLPF